MRFSKIKIIFLLVAVVVVVLCASAYMSLFAAPERGAPSERVVIAKGSSLPQIAEQLRTGGFIKNTWAFKLALRFKGVTGEIPAGGYKMSKAMSVWEVAGIFSGEPYMRWVTIPEGLRKEEIADILARELGWSDGEKQEWLTKDTAMQNDYVEGVYFPDTYLIPVDESPLDVANRLRAKFEEKFAQFSSDALKQNIKWTTVVKVASLIEREAAGKDDEALIAGVIWNRLLIGQKLDLDATVQYARGKTDAGWWSPIKPADKAIDSPYNTYKYKGLPPHPISNPGLTALSAAVRPEKTACLYYLHDKDKKIHCAVTFEEHQRNIETYLR